MDPFQVGAVRDILTTFIVAGSIVTALWLFLKHRRPRAGGSSQDLAELTHAIEALQTSVESMRAELSEVHDRLDFTERLLAQVTHQPRELRSP